MKKSRILFLTLNIFSATGGIEKVCKIVAKGLSEIVGSTNGRYNVFSMHDSTKDFDNRYLDINFFIPFHSKKLQFAVQSIKQSFQSDIVVFSHVNLLAIGIAIKFLQPRKKLILFVHGIEVWNVLPAWKRYFINKFDTIICVSNYTKAIMVGAHKIDETRCQVLNNCIDPFLQNVTSKIKDSILLAKYNLQQSDTILFTISRLSPHDRDKGIDKVLFAISELKSEFPNLKYVIIGKYQNSEKQWLDKLITDYSLENSVVFTGFIADNELASHMNLGDIYIMPSKKEGFGIIFIEALFFGKPVIAGNLDGSVDALANGEFGILVNPESNEEIISAIKSIIVNKEKYIPDYNKVVNKFGYLKYKKSLQTILENI